jgi:glycosyltransferase involved in cell wall biosynthesis
MTPTVNPEWYLKTYPDVAAAGMDPQVHYQRYGRLEGRFPRPLHALTLENALWGGFSHPALPELEALFRDSSDADERLYAAWALMRWYAAQQDWRAAAACVDTLSGKLPDYIGRLGPVLLRVEVLLQCGRREEARHALRTALKQHGMQPDLCLAAANAGLPLEAQAALDETALRLTWINRALAKGGLAPLSKLDPLSPLELDNLQGDASQMGAVKKSPKISVIMPVFNAAGCVETALCGLLRQTWRNLEVIVVDDGSTDETPDVVQTLARQDRRIRLLRQTENRGAYAARNVGLEQATGKFITNHDSDDWSHPQRLERMVHPLLKDKRRMAAMAHWVRADSALHFQRWRMEEGLIHPSVSTLMFRRKALRKLGGWDEVKVAADTELYQRIRRIWGEGAVQTILPGVPLAFARQTAASLTASAPTHLRTQFWGVRRLYRELSETWHATVKSSKELYIGRAVRPFPAPPQLVRHAPESPHYDWVIMTDCGPDSAHTPVVRFLLEMLPAANVSVGLFHWPDYRRLQAMDNGFLEQAVEGRLDILLGNQSLCADRLVMIGSCLQARPPDDVPRVRFEKRDEIENPAEMITLLSDQGFAVHAMHRKLIEQSGLFQADWYLRRYLDVKQAGVEPLDHYLLHGGREGRDPGPEFETALYLEECPRACQSDEAPLLHYIKTGRTLGCAAVCPERAGAAAWQEGRPTILVCAHAAERQVFGAERSLLDVLEACRALQLNVLVSVPRMVNRVYIKALQDRVYKVVYVPVSPWNARQEPCAWAVARLGELIGEYGVAAVQVNTMMLREPLLAARRAKVPALVQVRESLQHDDAICSAIGLSPRKIRRRLLRQADYVLANSAFTARCFAKPGKTFIVGNVVDLEKFRLPGPLDAGPLRVAMISSNLPKKGLHDFIEVARRLQADTPRVKMLLIGPDNVYTQSIRQGLQNGSLPGNLELAGYAESPPEAMARADVVLNLSHVEETFGRTVLEAMVARRPVIAYRWGALPELIEDGVNGFLVPLGDVDGVAEKIRLLHADRRRLTDMGEAGCALAAGYGPRRLVGQLGAVYHKVLGNEIYRDSDSGCDDDGAPRFR